MNAHLSLFFALNFDFEKKNYVFSIQNFAQGGPLQNFIF